MERRVEAEKRWGGEGRRSSGSWEVERFCFVQLQIFSAHGGDGGDEFIFGFAFRVSHLSLLHIIMSSSLGTKANEVGAAADDLVASDDASGTKATSVARAVSQLLGEASKSGASTHVLQVRFTQLLCLNPQKISIRHKTP